MAGIGNIRSKTSALPLGVTCRKGPQQDPVMSTAWRLLTWPVYSRKALHVALSVLFSFLPKDYSYLLGMRGNVVLFSLCHSCYRVVITAVGCTISMNQKHKIKGANCRKFKFRMLAFGVQRIHSCLSHEQCVAV